MKSIGISQFLTRLTFLKNGKIGSVNAFNKHPFGMTNNAINAARRIRFRPALRNGNPISFTKRIQYRFRIY
ncbi:MAG: hypothetical protein HKN25_17815 [Pyrinomonadaceae bacterium]|nr:hypothetical protein [Pyrinomonadaceae bacterium]